MSVVERFGGSVGTRLDGSPLAVMLDIDGTLAPIAPRPEEAVVPSATLRVLRSLLTLPDVTLALITGRSAEVARRMVDVSGAWVIGNHGLELLTPDGILTVRPEVHEHEASVAEAARALAPLQQEVPGAIVENKRWSLSVHYRLSAARAVPMLERRAREIAQTFGLRVTEGKMIIELRPPVPLDKGTAALALAEQVASLDANASVFLAGDDQTDEDAFRALRRRLPHGVTARILSDTDAADTRTDAEFILRSPDELRQVLEWLVTRRKRA